MATATYDLNEIKRRMQGAMGILRQELSGLRTGRASLAGDGQARGDRELRSGGCQSLRAHRSAVRDCDGVELEVHLVRQVERNPLGSL